MYMMTSVSELEKKIFVKAPQGHNCYMLIGGKESLQNKCNEWERSWMTWKGEEGEIEKKSKIIYVRTRIVRGMTEKGALDLFWNFWKNILSQIKETDIKVEKPIEKLRKNEYMNRQNKVFAYESPWVDCSKDVIKEMLQYLYELGIHLILVVEDFQNTKMEKGTDTAGFFNYLYDISPKSGGIEYNFSMLLLSEENSETIAKPHMRSGSRFSAAFEEVIL